MIETFSDDGTEESAMMKKVKSDAWDYISRCILSPGLLTKLIVTFSLIQYFKDYFENITEELVKTVVELIERENEVEKMKKYVAALHNLLNVVK